MQKPARTLIGLGDLEVQTLEFLWESGGATAKQAHEKFGVQRGITLNTVQSTLERLFRKGYLSREKTSHAYRYQTKIERESLLASLINDVLGQFHSDSASSAAAFINATESLDESALQALEEALRKRRQEEQAE